MAKKKKRAVAAKASQPRSFSGVVRGFSRSVQTIAKALRDLVYEAGVFDDWDEIESLLAGSYRLIAPKRTVALLDSQQQESKAPRRRKSARRST